MSLFKPDGVCTRLQSLLREYHSFSKVMLFGSRARGDCTETSDYDLAVWAEDESQSGAFLAALEELPTLHSFDVVFIRPRHLGTALYDSILGEGVVLMDKFAHKLGNFRQALGRLREGIADAMQTGNLTMRDGAIQRFEFTAELAWKTAREYLLQQQVQDINNPKAVMREAWKNKLIADEAGWLQLLQDRNITSHIYDEQDADAVFRRLQERHLRLLEELAEVLQDKAGNTGE